MQLINAPGKLVLPFANSGAKNAIPVASQIGIVAGAASLTDGFPPLTRTPLAAGGVPPSGLDMNGIIYELSAILRWANAGGGYVYDGTFAADSNVGGYPKGARVLRSDGLGYWFNTADNNTTDPEGAGAVAAGWVPDFTNGVAAVTMTGSNVTLTPLQYGKPVIVITGTLTANLNLVFPTIVNEWTVINNTTGPYTITCKTAAGTGLVVNTAARIVGDGTNIQSAVTQPDASETVKGIVELATVAEAQAFTANKFIDGEKLAEAFKGSNYSLATNGYQKLPSGLIIQWGVASGSPTSLEGSFYYFSPLINLPITFPNACLSVQATANGDRGGTEFACGGNFSTSQVKIYGYSTSSGGTLLVPWLAIGY